jgi:hypothetical protein
MSNKNASPYESIRKDLSAGSPYQNDGPERMSEMRYTGYSKKRFASTVTPGADRTWNDPMGRMTMRIKQWIKWDMFGGEERRLCPPADADVVISLLPDGRHAPVLDLDLPHRLVPSTTEGHSHLYLDVPMSWRQYKRLLKALAKAGVLEQGYVEASLYRRHTAARMPWVKKAAPQA